MEKAYSLNKTSWFVNPWFDMFLLLGLVTIVFNYFLTFRIPYIRHLMLIHDPVAVFHFFIEIMIWKTINRSGIIINEAQELWTKPKA